LPVAGKEIIYRQVENSFTQPNAAMNIQMLEWAIDVTRAQKATCWSCIAAMAISR
jgi:tRNA (uracil-5-)-methyltransferase